MRFVNILLVNLESLYQVLVYYLVLNMQKLQILFQNNIFGHSPRYIKSIIVYEISVTINLLILFEHRLYLQRYIISNLIT